MARCYIWSPPVWMYNVVPNNNNGEKNYQIFSMGILHYYPYTLDTQKKNQEILSQVKSNTKGIINIIYIRILWVYQIAR